MSKSFEHFAFEHEGYWITRPDRGVGIDITVCPVAEYGFSFDTENNGSEPVMVREVADGKLVIRELKFRVVHGVVKIYADEESVMQKLDAEGELEDSAMLKHLPWGDE